MSTKATAVENKIPDTTCFITTLDFNRLTKINFDARMTEAKPTFIHNTDIALKFAGSCLNQNITFRHRNVVNSLIVYEFDKCSRDLNTDFTLGD